MRERHLSLDYRTAASVRRAVLTFQTERLLILEPVRRDQANDPRPPNPPQTGLMGLFSQTAAVTRYDGDLLTVYWKMNERDARGRRVVYKLPHARKHNIRQYQAENT